MNDPVNDDPASSPPARGHPVAAVAAFLSDAPFLKGVATGFLFVGIVAMASTADTDGTDAPPAEDRFARCMASAAGAGLSGEAHDEAALVCLDAAY